MCTNQNDELNELFKTNNLSIFLGSGASMPLMPDMTKLLYDIKIIVAQQAAKNKELKKNITAINNNKNNSLEEYLNNLIILKMYYEKIGDVSFKDIEEIVIKVKECIFYKLNIIEYNNQNENIENWEENKSITIENYINMYLSLVTWRTIYEKYMPINIFTTNYDLLNEYSMDKLNLNYTTGFKGDYKSHFFSESFKFKLINETNFFKQIAEDSIIQFRLYKLHGSLNWIREENNIDTVIKKELNNEANSSICLLPTSDKSINALSSPFFILFSAFINVLNKKNMVLLIFGYGFKDIHINEYIENSLKINNTLKIYIMIYTKCRHENCSYEKNLNELCSHENSPSEEHNDISCEYIDCFHKKDGQLKYLIKIFKYPNVSKFKSKNFGDFWKEIIKQKPPCKSKSENTFLNKTYENEKIREVKS